MALTLVILAVSAPFRFVSDNFLSVLAGCRGANSNTIVVSAPFRFVSDDFLGVGRVLWRRN